MTWSWPQARSIAWRSRGRPCRRSFTLFHRADCCWPWSLHLRSSATSSAVSTPHGSTWAPAISPSGRCRTPRAGSACSNRPGWSAVSPRRSLSPAASRCSCSPRSRPRLQPARPSRVRFCSCAASRNARARSQPPCQSCCSRKVMASPSRTRARSNAIRRRPSAITWSMSRLRKETATRPMRSPSAASTQSAWSSGCRAARPICGS